MLDRISALLPLVLLFGLSVPASAQSGSPADDIWSESRFGISTGMFMPRDTHSQTLSTAQDVDVRFSDVTTYGLSLEVPLGTRWVAGRVNLDFGPGQVISGRGGPCNPGDFCGDWAFKGDLWLANADVIFRPFAGRLLRPHLLVGGGTQHFTGDERQCIPGNSAYPICQTISSYAQEEWRASGRVATGLELHLGRLVIGSEFGSHLSRIVPEGPDSEGLGLEPVKQYGLYWTVGVLLMAG